MLFLVLSDVARYPHAAHEQFEQFVVELVDLRTQFRKALRRGVGFADHQTAADVGQTLRRHLLGLVAPRAVGRTVRFDDQPVESEVHGLLRKRRDQFAAASDVAGVAEDLQARQAAVQFDGDRPHRMVAVETLVDRREAAVNAPQTADAGVVDALHAADPQFEVRTHGILDQHRNVVAAQRVGDLLHGKGVGRGAGADPDHVDAPFQRRHDMLARGDLGGGVHPCFAFYALEPCHAFGTHALEPSGFGAGLPKSGAENPHAFGGQFAGGFDHLLFGFGAARSRDDQRAPGIESRKIDGLQIFHISSV